MDAFKSELAIYYLWLYKHDMACYNIKGCTSQKHLNPYTL